MSHFLARLISFAVSGSLGSLWFLVEDIVCKDAKDANGDEYENFFLKQVYISCLCCYLLKYFVSFCLIFYLTIFCLCLFVCLLVCCCYLLFVFVLRHKERNQPTYNQSMYYLSVQLSAVRFTEIIFIRKSRHSSPKVFREESNGKLIKYVLRPELICLTISRYVVHDYRGIILSWVIVLARIHKKLNQPTFKVCLTMSSTWSLCLQTLLPGQRPIIWSSSPSTLRREIKHYLSYYTSPRNNVKFWTTEKTIYFKNELNGRAWNSRKNLLGIFIPFIF